jgi:hypothetical protein
MTTLAPSLPEEALLASATELTGGLTSFGPAHIRAGLRALIDATEREARLSDAGLRRFRERCLASLSNRLRIEDAIARQPQIEALPLQPPIFILGMLRTGTTMLHQMLGLDPRLRPVRLYELLDPVPPELKPGQLDPRLVAAEELCRWYEPVRAVHELTPDGPDECQWLFQNAFTTPFYSVEANRPSYFSWYLEQDRVVAYRDYRRQLQLVIHRDDANRTLLLKAPQHLANLGALLAVFPDARIVHTHRDPAKALASTCSLTAGLRSLGSDDVRRDEIGAQLIDRFRILFDNYRRVRASANPRQFIDVHYHELLRDPVAAVDRVYAAFELPRPPGLADNVRQWLEANRQHAHGVHRYQAEDYGLDAKTIRQQLSWYCETFDIPSE